MHVVRFLFFYFFGGGEEGARVVKKSWRQLEGQSLCKVDKNWQSGRGAIEQKLVGNNLFLNLFTWNRNFETES